MATANHFRLWILRGLIGLVLIGLVGPTDPLGSTPATAQGSIASEIIYTVDLATRKVFVVETFELGIGSDTFETLIPTDATDLDATVGFSRATTGELLDTLEMRPSGVRSFSISYTLTSASGRSSLGDARVNESFTGFALWPFHATQVKVILPVGFRSKSSLRSFTELEVGKDTYEYTAEIMGSDELWGYGFVALQDAALETRLVDAGVDTIEIAGWQSDPDWLEFTARYVAGGVPVLQELIGQDWPEENLRIFESTAPGREGYAGWYDRSASEIEISDSLDATTLLHELSHAWFNDRFYTDRWMIEGFAEEMSNEALFRLDGEAIEPTTPGEIPKGFDGLATWRPRFFFEDTWDHEFFGYETSWFVIDSLGDEIGSEGMARTIAAMQSGRGVYSLDDEPVLYPANDWRRFLDMLEHEGGSTKAEALFKTWVLAEEDQPLLERRALAVASLEEFADSDMDSVPFGVRDAVSRWHFDVAATRLAEAKTVRSDLDRLVRRADALELTLPSFFQEFYLEADQHFTVVQRLMVEADGVLDGLEANVDDMTAADRSNFEVGRFNLVESTVTNQTLNELNTNRAPEPSVLWLYLIAIGGLLFVSVASWGLRKRLRTGVIPEEISTLTGTAQPEELAYQ
jgi:hypothetical protein